MVKLLAEPFAAFAELAAFERTLDMKHFGANCNFIGTMRDFNEGDQVQGMFLEHYPQMTEKQLHKLIAQAKQQYPVEAMIVHRVGAIAPGENIVITAAWSAHRKAAFDACRFLIEQLKHSAPFWKKETLADGSSRWVSHNT